MGSIMKVLVFGTTPPCRKCMQAEREARQAAEQFPAGVVVVEKHDALSEYGQRYGVNITPTIVINGRKVAAGKLLSQQELVEAIRKEMGVSP
ncbi:Thioredoxin domain-containing protein [Desulfofundulus australicus DSM 11792]|uniref:Thioredoxin domain-containing protein n=1 Tax=Desulfofundulus australicus DSM 11792 TaxID=1121425 RepID=A0A1M4ZAJ0_9FIRM|nr:thioredoxin family protein [Desulfofundulus australicus]SHF15024.1 Thioredoxin domain-containing protein [Desulfofundulus australicus DSM 11792]